MRFEYSPLILFYSLGWIPLNRTRYFRLDEETPPILFLSTIEMGCFDDASLHWALNVFVRSHTVTLFHQHGCIQPVKICNRKSGILYLFYKFHKQRENIFYTLLLNFHLYFIHFTSWIIYFKNSSFWYVGNW